MPVVCRRSTYNHLSSWLTDARNLTNPNTVSLLLYKRAQWIFRFFGVLCWIYTCQSFMHILCWDVVCRMATCWAFVRQSECFLRWSFWLVTRQTLKPSEMSRMRRPSSSRRKTVRLAYVSRWSSWSNGNVRSMNCISHFRVFDLFK